MERTEGQIRFVPNTTKGDNIVGWIDMANHGVLTVAASANVDKDKAKANALHLVNCWNAFEPDGLVGEMENACRDAYLDLVKGNIEDTQAGKILKAVLTRYDKEVGE